MAHALNAAYTAAFTFRSLADALVTGKVNDDFTKAAYLSSNGATTATVVVAAVSGQSGRYAATYTPTAVGIWRCEVECMHTDGHIYRWEDEIEVVTAAQADPPTAAAIVAAMLTAGVALTTPLNPATGTITLVKGDDYLAADNRALTFDATGFPSLIGGSVEWRAIRDRRTRVSKAMSVVDADSTYLELTDTDTNKLRVGGDYTYEVVATVGTSTLTIASGALVVTAS